MCPIQRRHDGTDDIGVVCSFALRAPAAVDDIVPIRLRERDRPPRCA